MGEFDDVLAMEPGDEWDAYDTGGELGGTEVVPRAILEVPGAVVHLTGDVPEGVLDALGVVTVGTPSSVVGPPPAVVLVEQVQGGHRVTHSGTSSTVTGSDDDLLECLSQALAEIAAVRDVGRSHLVATSMVRADGTGVLLVGPVEHRLDVARALTGRGASVHGANRVVLTPGSRSVIGVPEPSAAVGSAVQQGPAQVAVIAFLEPSQDAGTTALTRAHGCARLLGTASVQGVAGSVAVDAVSVLSGGADFHEVGGAGPEAVADLVDGLVGSGARDLVVRQALADDASSPLLVRIGRTAALVDPGSGHAIELADDELATMDSLSWPRSIARPAEAPEVLARVAEAGIDLRHLPATDRDLPGPESYGLTDSPVGAASARWSDEAVRAAVDADPSMAWPLGHGLGSGDLVVAADTAAHLEHARDEDPRVATSVHAALHLATGVLDGANIGALVLGAVALAADGVMPDDMVPVSRVELLVAHDLLAPAAAALVAAGWATPESAGPDELAGVDGLVRLRGERGIEVVLVDRVAPGPFGELVDHEDLRARGIPVRIAGRWLSSLHPADRFVAECVTHQAERAPSLSRARSVVAAGPGSEPGAAAALEASERWGATRAVLTAVREVDAVLPGLHPMLVGRAGGPARRGLSRFARRR